MRIVSKRGREAAKDAGNPTPDIDIDLTFYTDEELDELIRRGSSGSTQADLFDDYEDYLIGGYIGVQPVSDVISVSMLDTITP